MFPIDKIVFNQQQLDEICGDESISVILCDNKFLLPQIGGRKYTAIGNVEAKIQLSQSAAEQLNIVFDNFIPEYEEKNSPIYANAERGIRPLNRYRGKSETDRLFNLSSYSSSFAGSFVSSFASSFGTELIGSFTTSFSGSFAEIFANSFVGFSGSEFSSSFAGNYAFLCKFLKKRKDYIVKEFAVNGYGINLI